MQALIPILALVHEILLPSTCEFLGLASDTVKGEFLFSLWWLLSWRVDLKLLLVLQNKADEMIWNPLVMFWCISSGAGQHVTLWNLLTTLCPSSIWSSVANPGDVFFSPNLICSVWVAYLGKGWKQGPRSRSMKRSVKRRCLLPLRCEHVHCALFFFLVCQTCNWFVGFELWFVSLSTIYLVNSGFV
jgi:hypothetical protein